MLSLFERHGRLEENAAAAEVAEDSGREATAAFYLQLEVLLEGVGDGVSLFPSSFGNLFSRIDGE